MIFLFSVISDLILIIIFTKEDCKVILIIPKIMLVYIYIQISYYCMTSIMGD